MGLQFYASLAIRELEQIKIGSCSQHNWNLERVPFWILGGCGSRFRPLGFPGLLLEWAHHMWELLKPCFMALSVLEPCR
jgi:hypothetical protein